MKTKTYKKILKLYCWWSNLTQKLEKRFLKTEKIPECYAENYPSQSWSVLTRKFRHYGTDPWYKAFDSISSPERFMYKKTGDCDDFALLAHSFMPQTIQKRDMGQYDFDGLYTLYFGSLTGHVIAVWIKRGVNPVDSPLCFIVDNKYAYFCDKPWDNWTEYNGKRLKLVGKLGIDKDGKLFVRAAAEALT